MRLPQSVLATLPQTKKPQRKFIAHLLRLPGHATFRNLSRYSTYHERTPDRVRGRLFARWYNRAFDFVSINKAAITQVITTEHQQALVIGTSFIPKSGAHTYGLEPSGIAATGAVKKVWKFRFWLGSTSPTPAPMASASSTRPRARRPLSHKAHASMPISINCDVWSASITWARCTM